MASAHDAKSDPTYHQLFGHARMVKDLLNFYTPPEIQESLNLRGGVLALNTRHHPTLHDKREGDRTLLVAREGDPQAILVRLEFQSTQDADMTLRVALYNALLWQDLRAGEVTPVAMEGDAPLPEPAQDTSRTSSAPSALLPILPFVIYNGKEPWHGRDGASLRQRVNLGSLQGLERLQLEVNFLLVDIRRVELPEELRGPLDVLFALEQLRDNPAGAKRVMEALPRILPDDTEHASLREAFRRFIIGVLKATGVKISRKAMRTLEGIVSNFAESIELYGKKNLGLGMEMGMEMIRAAYQKLGRLPSLVEDDRLMKHIKQHNLTTAEIEAASKADIEAWIAPPAEAAPPSASGKARTNGRKKS